jgi:hypothetical protein
MINRKYTYLSALVLIVLFFSVEGLAAPKLTIKPKVAATWQVDKNFYKAEATEREVSTYLIQPGLDLGLETAKSSLSLNYTMDDYNYDDRSGVPPGQLPADREDYLGHTAILRARNRAFDRLLLGLEDSYYKTRDPAQSDVFSNSIARDKYTINRLTPLVFYEFARKFSIGLRYRHTETDYDITTREDATEHRGMFDLVYNFTPKTSLDLEYQRWKMDYDLATSDYTSDQVKLIFRKQFRYFSLEAGGGYHERSFDADTPEDIDVITYRVALKGQNPPAPERPRSHITFAGDQNFNVSGGGEEYFKARRFALNAGHVFVERIVVTIDSYYQVSDYETATREDETYKISGSIGYMVTEWLTFSITAGTEERDSSVAGYDYDNRYYMAKLDFIYNLGRR